MHIKMTRVTKYALTITLALCVLVFAGCGETSGTPAVQPGTTAQPPTTTQPSASSTEQPVPAGSGAQVSGSDIPDTQVFVTYSSSPGKYQLEVPEGWAQTINGTNVSFASNLNALQVTMANGSTQPTATSVRNDQVVSLQQTGRAVRDVQVRDVQLSSGSAVLIVYTSNSDPNPVTNKQVRLENNRYLFFKNGKLVTLTLSAPVGADNVDQWARIAGSFKWV